MIDENLHIPDWLAALHCPICGEVKLSRAWKVPDAIRDVLRGFGPRHPPARRWIVVRLDTMADNHWSARNHEPVFGLDEAKVHFQSTARAARNLLNKLRELQVRQAIVMANVINGRIVLDIPQDETDLDCTTPLERIDDVLKLIEEGALDVMRDPDIYLRPLGRRAAGSRKKHLESTHLWQPLFELMHEFGIADFGKYQELTKTVGALHRALGIDPPDANLLKQVSFLWRKRRLNSPA